MTAQIRLPFGEILGSYPGSRGAYPAFRAARRSYVGADDPTLSGEVINGFAEC